MATMNTINKVLARMPDDMRQSNQESLTYIKYLLSVTNTSPKRWNLFKIFGEEDNEQQFIIDRNELNKRFMEHLTAQKAKQIESISESLGVMPELMIAVEKGLNKSLEARRKDYQYQVTIQTQALERQHAEVNYILTNLNNARTQLEQLDGENAASAIKEEIEVVLKDGYWTNPIVYNNYLYLNTQEEIILTQKNKAANIDIELNVGKFAVKISLSNFLIEVIPYKNNVSLSTMDGSYYHPHVSTQGSICWGDAYQNVSNWLATRNLGKVLKMLYALLFTYSDTNPYVTLQRMKNNCINKGRTSLRLRHPERISSWKKDAAAKKARLAVIAASDTSTEETKAPAEEA